MSPRKPACPKTGDCFPGMDQNEKGVVLGLKRLVRTGGLRSHRA